MLDITPLKILIVLLVALVVLGPDRLPRIAHQVARAWADVRRFHDQLSSEIQGAVLGERPTGAATQTETCSEATSVVTGNGSANPERGRREDAPETASGQRGLEPDQAGHDKPSLN
jgi:Sec-independent protein translocase protein TatA